MGHYLFLVLSLVAFAALLVAYWAQRSLVNLEGELGETRNFQITAF